MRSKSLAWLICFNLFLTSEVCGQLSNDKKLSQFILKNYTVEQGLHSNTLLNLRQTDDGFIWIGAYNGLARFDGKEFKIFDISNVEGLTANSILDLIIINGNELLFGTQGRGAFILKNEKAKLVHPQLSDKYVTCLTQASNHDIWIGTSNQGLYVVKKTGITSIPLGDHSELRITKIIEISPEEFWAATETKGVLIIKSGVISNKLDKEDGLNDNYVYDLLKHDRDVYVCTQTGLNTINLKSKKITDEPELKGIAINKVAVDSHKNLWTATVRGVFRKRANNPIEVLNKKSGLTNDDIRDILFDKEGNAWFTTYRGGLYQLSDGKFTNYNAGDGLSSSDVRTIFEWKKGEHLIGSQNGEIDVIDNNTISKFPLHHSFDAGIYDMIQDHSGNLWIASYNGLLKREVDGSEKFFSKANGLNSNLLMCLLVDKHNRLWIGTRDKGIMIMKDDQVVTTYSTTNVLNSNLIMCLQQDAKGNILVGTNTAGFYVFENGADSVKHYSTNNGLATNLVFNISIDKTDPERIWIALNQGGLAMLSKGKLTMLNNSVIPETQFFDILEDDYGYFWIPAAQGILLVSKKELIANWNDPTAIVDWKLFSAQDGLKSQQCLGAAKSRISFNGEIWIPMATGLVRINPGKIKKNEVIPPLYVSGVEIDNHSLDSAFNNLQIEPGLKRMSITYGGVSYYFNDGMRYKVKLEPYDDDWLDVQTRREVVYTNLPQGKYTFKVKVSNSDGVWNEAGASFQFIIKPHFYETYIFYLIAGLVGFVGIFLFVKFRTYQITSRNKLLQGLIEEKTHELQKNLDDLKRAQVQLVQSEKMASLGLLTAGIAHEINNPVNFISVGIAALERKLNQLNERINGNPDKEIAEAQENINQLIKDIKIGTSRTEEIISSLRTFSHLDKAELKIADVNEGIESTLVLLNSRFKNRIEIVKHLDNNLSHILCYPGQLNQVFMNILSNAADAIKGKGTITITTSKVDNHIEISIADTGCGIPKAVQEKIFEPFFTTKDVGFGTGLGLSISYGIIEQHKGIITVSSEPGGGTAFTIKLPINFSKQHEQIH